MVKSTHISIDPCAVLSLGLGCGFFLAQSQAGLGPKHGPLKAGWHKKLEAKNLENKSCSFRACKIPGFAFSLMEVTVSKFQESSGNSKSLQYQKRVRILPTVLA